jgi:hypothetical protein
MVFAAMSAIPFTDYVPGQPGDRFDPYVCLIRSLLPRTSSVAMFGPSGELMWSTETELPLPSAACADDPDATGEHEQMTRFAGVAH